MDDKQPNALSKEMLEELEKSIKVGKRFLSIKPYLSDPLENEDHFDRYLKEILASSSYRLFEFNLFQDLIHKILIDINSDTRSTYQNILPKWRRRSTQNYTPEKIKLANIFLKFFKIELIPEPDIKQNRSIDLSIRVDFHSNSSGDDERGTQDIPNNYEEEDYTNSSDNDNSFQEKRSTSTVNSYEDPIQVEGRNEEGKIIHGSRFNGLGEIAKSSNNNFGQHTPIYTFHNKNHKNEALVNKENPKKEALKLLQNEIIEKEWGIEQRCCFFRGGKKIVDITPPTIAALKEFNDTELTDLKTFIINCSNNHTNLAKFLKKLNNKDVLLTSEEIFLIRDALEKTKESWSKPSNSHFQKGVRRYRREFSDPKGLLAKLPKVPDKFSNLVPTHVQSIMYETTKAARVNENDKQNNVAYDQSYGQAVKIGLIADDKLIKWGRGKAASEFYGNILDKLYVDARKSLEAINRELKNNPEVKYIPEYIKGLNKYLLDPNQQCDLSDQIQLKQLLCCAMNFSKYNSHIEAGKLCASFFDCLCVDERKLNDAKNETVSNTNLEKRHSEESRSGIYVIEC